MFAVFVTVLCLVAVSHSAPLSCEDLVRPLDQLNFPDMVGRWAFVAGSLNNSAAAEAVKGRDSVTLTFRNSTYTQGIRAGGQCEYHTYNISMEGHLVKIKVKAFNFTGTFLHTSCPDCAVLTLDVESLIEKSVDLYLLSKRRQLEEKEMEEFRAQVECLKMPPPLVMDPAQELCPEQPHTEETPEGQNA